MRENKKIRRTFFKVMTGFIFGGAIGSILGLTLAPRKGKETRKIIHDKSMDLYLRSKRELENDKQPGLIKRTLIKLLTRKK